MLKLRGFDTPNLNRVLTKGKGILKPFGFLNLTHMLSYEIPIAGTRTVLLVFSKGGLRPKSFS
ncbi:MAG: hypothetical protein CM15mP22_4210 [Gammaproteobacteria bacterium]|nr:MAG: hypothetical protein CM15mP22_4210 [Gammaproteobacteria bacterium]